MELIILFHSLRQKTMTLELKEIIEGRTRLLVPVGGKQTRDDPVFYNPVMELSRDLSVAVASIVQPKAYCDLLAGSGARGIRIANEVGCPTTLNDVNPEGFELIKKNAEINKVDVIAKNMEGNRLLSESWFDHIDIDPFGSPVRFTDCAVRALGNGGTLSLTATDTAALCGSSPGACRRKYDAAPLRTDYYNELGLRILIGHVARTACRHEKGIYPLFSHCTHHYFKTYLEVRRGPGRATETQKNLNYLQHCFSCRFRAYRKLDDLERNCICGERLRTAGPLWTGRFADPEFCAKLSSELQEGNYGMAKEAIKTAEIVSKEQDVTLPYYNVHKVARSMGVSSRTMEELIKEFRIRGYDPVRTHFEDLGLRIDANITEISDVIANKVK
jgi:tRNA (guanine26-N2/guanine27-N2)-dimethyltransferase